MTCHCVAFVFLLSCKIYLVDSNAAFVCVARHFHLHKGEATYLVIFFCHAIAPPPQKNIYLSVLEGSLTLKCKFSVNGACSYCLGSYPLSSVPLISLLKMFVGLCNIYCMHDFYIFVSGTIVSVEAMFLLLLRWYVTFGHELIWKNREPLVKVWHAIRTRSPRKWDGFVVLECKKRVQKYCAVWRPEHGLGIALLHRKYGSLVSNVVI